MSIQHGNNKGYVNHTDIYLSYQALLCIWLFICIYINLPLRRQMKKKEKIQNNWETRLSKGDTSVLR